MAQLGARFHGMEEVVGSNPTRSTKISSKLRLDDCSKWRYFVAVRKHSEGGEHGHGARSPRFLLNDA